MPPRAVLASFDGDPAHAFVNILGGAAYVGVTLGVIRPLLARWAARANGAELTDREFMLCLALLATGAWFTDRIGVRPGVRGFRDGHRHAPRRNRARPSYGSSR